MQYYRALTLLICAVPLQAAQEPVVLVTADRGGALLPCGDCPREAALGGAARMGTLVSEQRGDGPVLLLDAGNAFFGSSDALGAPGAAVRDLYDAVGYDVVNIGYRDFRFGLDVTLELMASAAFVPVSVNLFDAAGQPLFDPFTVEEIGGSAVAVVGVTMRPPGLDYLPHLQRQLAGVTVADPLEALADVLPAARSGADYVVLLCYGDRELIEAVSDRFGNELDAIVAGGIRPADLPREGPTILAASSPDGQHLTRFVLGDEAQAVLLELGPEIADDSVVLEVLADRLIQATFTIEDVSHPLPPEAPITTGPRQSVDVHSGEAGFGNGLMLSVSSVAKRSKWQGLEAPSGRSWMVFELEVENDIPASLAFSGSRAAGEVLLVALKQKLFLVCGEDARTVLPATLIDKPEDLTTLLPERFRLNSMGDSLGGEVAFAVAEDAFASGALQVRLYHDEVPVATVDVRGVPRLDENESAQLNAYASIAPPLVSFPITVGGRAPPEGTRWVVATLLGRSLTDGPAIYLEADSHLELLVDGMWARRAEPELGSLPPEPVFLPDRFTGGSAVFLAPVEVRSLELSCAFPLYTLENGDELQPETLRLPLEGEAVVPEAEEAAIVIDDGPLPLAVIGVERHQAIGDLRAEEGRTLLVLDCRVESRGGGGMFGPRERFLMADAIPTATLDRANLRLIEPLLVPANARRAFRVVLDAPDAVGGPTEVTYAGVSVRPTFMLEVPYEVLTLESPSAQPGELTLQGDAELGAVWREHATPVNEPSWSLEPGAMLPDPPAVSAGGVTLDITATSLSAELGKYKAKEGEVFLVLDVELHLAPDAAPLTITGLSKYMIGVIDRHRLLGLHLLRRRGDLGTSFTLAPGDTSRGKIIFDLPREGMDSFSLELVPSGREGLHVPILESAHPRAVPFDSQRNRALGADVLGFAAHEEIDGMQPSVGKVLVAVDLRVRNHLAGDTLPPGLLRWHAMPDRVQLVIDGFHPIGLRKSAPTEMLRELTLFPTETLGGRLVFDVAPELLAEARSVELVCGFEPVEIPGGGLLYPESLRFQLVGERPDLAIGEGVHRIEDVDCTVVVDSFEQPGVFVDHAPKVGTSWLTAGIWLTAPRDRGVTIHPLRRFTLTDVGGASHSIHRYTWNLPTPSKSGRPFWVPAGGQRHFTVAFQVPNASVEGAALVYRGLSHASALPIDPSDAARVPAVDPRRATNGQLIFDEALEPRGLSGVGLRPEQVNRAIDRGREFLWGHLQGLMKKGELSGGRNDYPAILALLHCNAHGLHPEFDQALRRLLDRLEPQKLGVYELGLVSMIVDALDDPALAPLFEKVLVCLVESQGPEGAWGYGTRLPERLVRQFDPEPASMASDPAFLLEVIGGDPPQARGAEFEEITRTQSWYENRDGDNSVSQFAVLGLAAAERHQLAIDSETWRGILGLFAGRQNLTVGRDGFGGWSYTNGNPYGSMSCAGICSTAIAIRRFDPTADPRRDLRIRDGLAWLDRNWTVTENPGSKQWHYYFLYGLERVGRILDIEFIGEHEWYPEGAKFLVGAQSADGSWPGEKKEADPRIATSFALMFLTRATESLELDDDAPELIAEGPGTLQTRIDLPAGTDNVYVILDASGSMLSKIDGRRKFDIARDAVQRLIEALPQETQFALRVYGHRKRAIEEGAAEDTELLVPFARLDPEALSAKLEKLRPRGKTPLTLSLQEALRDLEKAPRGKDTLVILLTDGGEDTRQDPVAAAESWAGRSSARLLVMGFDIDRPVWERQLHAIADAAGGQYVAVDQAEELAARVVSVVTPEPPVFEVLNDAHETVARGRFGDEIPLEPGAYTLSFRFDGRPVNSSFWVSPGRVVRIHLDAASPSR